MPRNTMEPTDRAVQQTVKAEENCKKQCSVESRTNQPNCNPRSTYTVKKKWQPYIQPSHSYSQMKVVNTHIGGCSMSPSWWPWGRYSGQCKCKCKQLYTRILYTWTSRNFGTACLPRTQLNSWGFALSRTEAGALSKRLALPKAGLHQWLQVLRRPACMRRRHYAAATTLLALRARPCNTQRWWSWWSCYGMEPRMMPT